MTQTRVFNIMTFVIFSIFVSHCTPYLNGGTTSGNLGPVINKPSPENPDPEEPENPDPEEPENPDPEEPEPEPEIPNIKDWMEITDIPGKGNIYSQVVDQYYSLTLYTTSNQDDKQLIYPKADGTGFNQVVIKIDQKNFAIWIAYRLKASTLLQLYATNDTKFTLSLVGGNGDILNQAGGYPFEKLTNNSLLYKTGSEFMNKPEYENQAMFWTFSYTGTDGNIYYIKYPFIFSYT